MAININKELDGEHSAYKDYYMDVGACILFNQP